MPTLLRGRPKTGGWNPYEIYELPDDEWSAARLLWDLEVAKEMAMGDSYHSEDGHARLFKQGSQLTRRSRPIRLPRSEGEEVG